MTTEPANRRRPGRIAVPLTTASVAAVAVTSVGWAATHPVGPTSQAIAAPVAAPAAARPTAAEVRTRHQLDALQRALRSLRRDIASLRSIRPAVPPASTGYRPGTGPPMAAPAPRPTTAYVAPPPAAAPAPAPPAVHATTGASGAGH